MLGPRREAQFLVVVVEPYVQDFVKKLHEQEARLAAPTRIDVYAPECALGVWFVFRS